MCFTYRLYWFLCSVSQWNAHQICTPLLSSCKWGHCILMELQSNAAGALWAVSLPFSWNALYVFINLRIKWQRIIALSTVFSWKIFIHDFPSLYRLQKGSVMSVLDAKDFVNCEWCSLWSFCLLCSCAALLPLTLIEFVIFLVCFWIERYCTSCFR
jgi:hypothetical protein